MFSINEKKFGGNMASLIFALPKRNKGSDKKEKFGKTALKY